MNDTMINRPITLNDLKKDAQLYDSRHKVTLRNGMFTYVTRQFSNASIDEMLNEFGHFAAAYYDTTGHLEDDKSLGYLNLHILLHFTTIAEQKNMAFADKVELFDTLLKLDYVEELFDAFLPEDLAKVYTRLGQLMDRYKQLLDSDEHLANDLKARIVQAPLQNKEEIMNVMFGDETKTRKETVL
ncbi:hypothetical protein M6D81_15345 [Paenibacillus sp. J5C_2022]|uniref:hypothetical protein n=1 Tax=Paenibacillus sp. J5C2022 TaxID=2977129 RepID=UPI0021D2807A|nr:hypothetical protein [Paenibacillus sp. J5C2022]MCU6710071.1 hypothetical protein [Paenibacillus sp. J5C2022]